MPKKTVVFVHKDSLLFFFIKHSIKHFFVRASLGFLRGLIVIKRILVPASAHVFQPFKSVGFVLLKVIGVPMYRGIFFSRRWIHKIFLPAKSRFFYILSNRYSIHAFIIALIAVVGIANIQTRNVRAETFGQKSVLYSLVSVDDSQTVETVVAGKDVLLSGGAMSYMSDAIENTGPHTDTDFYPEENVNGTVSVPSTVPSRDRIETYTIVEGDTIGRIAVKFNLSVSSILSANDLSLRSTLHLGDTLKILPEDGVLYTVSRGDTLSRIASKYSIDATEISRANGFNDGQTLRIGAEILLPGASEIAPSQAIARRSVSVKDIFVPSPVQSSPKNVQPVSSTASGWVWPTNWHIITQYYSWKHTGIDIDGDYTTFSLAAHDGIVSYAGWRSGYGLTIEIDHGNGLKTRYGHNSKIFVNTGDTVNAGEKLAQTGTTGRSTGTHLHFEVIKNGKFQNPLEYVR